MIQIRNLRSLRKALWHLRHGGLKQLKLHRSRRSATLRNQNALLIPNNRGRLDVQPWNTSLETCRRSSLNVAVILDEFSTLAWKYEWNQIPITPKSWKAELNNNRIDFLFVESAWSGNDGAWRYALTGKSAPSQEIIELINFCADQQIPTVFWNKEDPTHFTDFIKTAKLFDFIYTTEEGLVREYKEQCHDSVVSLLPFAAQAMIHNPIRPISGFHSRDVAFGGTYFAHRHPERRHQIDLLLGAANDASGQMEFGLEIYSRFLGRDKKYDFPTPLSRRVRGSLTYTQMLSGYRLHKVFLNVNTVINSSTMCARRIFEIVASGTPVVSTPSPAITKFFPDGGVFEVSDRTEAGYILQSLVNSAELRDRTVHKGQRSIWGAHTYEHRANEILSDLELNDYITPDLTASMLVSTNRPHQLEHVLKMSQSQQSTVAETLILTHGFDLSQKQIRELRSKFDIEHLSFLTAESRISLGECLNKLIQAASGDVVAKIDDDDFYSPFYLADQINALKYSRAEVVGKKARYIYFEQSELLALRNPGDEHIYTDFIAGPTIVTYKQWAEEVMFDAKSQGEDTSFLKKTNTAGGKIYASDRFNFIQYRRAWSDTSESRHTWQVGDWELLASSRVISSAYSTQAVTV